mgnify:CR=1 FL=1
MFYPFISQFNWFDILIIAVIFRIAYLGIKRGFGIEVFKTINIFFCSFVALHFYITLGEFIHSKITPFPAESASIFSYIVLIFVITMIFRILREGFFVFFKSETVGIFSKISGLFFGIFRGVVISGLIMYVFLISSNHYLELSARTSVIGPKIMRLPVKIYESILNGVAVKISSSQGFNQKVIEVLEKKIKN